MLLASRSRISHLNTQTKKFDFDDKRETESADGYGEDFIKIILCYMA